MSDQVEDYHYDRSMFFKELSQSIGKYYTLHSIKVTNYFLLTCI